MTLHGALVGLSYPSAVVVLVGEDRRDSVDSRIADGSIVAYRVPGSRRLLIDNEVIADIRARRVVPEAS